MKRPQSQVRPTTKGDSIFLPRNAQIVEKEELGPEEGLFLLQLDDGTPLSHTPGQFVGVSVYGIGEAPISVSSSPTRGPNFELGVRAIGSVTQALHRMKPGDRVGIRGPFGNGFPLETLAGRDLLFVAGGIGLYPLRSMIHYAVDKRADFGRLALLYGCREPAEQLFPNELAEWRKRKDIELFESVDKCPLDVAWEGSVGVITSLFPRISIDPGRTTALMVGPPVMYRYVAAECMKKGIAEQNILMSLERRMKCGIGLCGHCQLENTYICLEGPVFSCVQLDPLHEVEL